jgi:hypothetical protein
MCFSMCLSDLPGSIKRFHMLDIIMLILLYGLAHVSINYHVLWTIIYMLYIYILLIKASVSP